MTDQPYNRPSDDELPFPFGGPPFVIHEDDAPVGDPDAWDGEDPRTLPPGLEYEIDESVFQKHFASKGEAFIAGLRLGEDREAARHGVVRGDDGPSHWDRIYDELDGGEEGR